MHCEKQENTDLNHEIEELRRLISAPKDRFDILESTAHFRRPFFTSKEFLERVKPLRNAEIINATMDCFFRALEGMSDACCASVSENVVKRLEETNVKGMTSGLSMEVDLLELHGSDFIHGYIGAKDFQAIILYFARDNVGSINMIFQEEETGIARFFIPDLRDLSKSRIDMKIHMEGGFSL